MPNYDFESLVVFVIIRDQTLIQSVFEKCCRDRDLFKKINVRKMVPWQGSFLKKQMFEKWCRGRDQLEKNDF